MVCRECGGTVSGQRVYCSQQCKERFAWRKRKAKLHVDPEYHRQQLDADTARRRASGIKPMSRSVCAEAGCERPVAGRGLCKKHYQQERRRLGEVDHRGCKLRAGSWHPEEVVLFAVCSKPDLPTKIKRVAALVTVGIMPKCPLCDVFMAPDSGHSFTCSCGVHAEFNAEEVSWLVISAHHSRQQLARTAA